jgi:hypothetical protein
VPSATPGVASVCDGRAWHDVLETFCLVSMREEPVCEGGAVWSVPGVGVIGDWSPKFKIQNGSRQVTVSPGDDLLW